VNIGFGYTLISEQLSDVSGTYKIDALISEGQSGWIRTVPLIPVTGFSGNVFVTNTNIDYCHIQSIIREFENNTNFFSPSYTLSFIPEVQVNGKTKGKSFSDLFVPSLEFKYDGKMFVIKKNSDEFNPLSPTETGSVLYHSIQPNTFQLLGTVIPIRVFRQIGLWGLFFCGGGLVLLTLYIKNITVNNPELFVKVKYGSLLVDVNESNIEPSQKTITANSIDELARIAETQNKFIYYEKQSLSYLYYVNIDDVSFRFGQPMKKFSSTRPKKGFHKLFRKAINK
jgi:hypothetical protein